MKNELLWCQENYVVIMESDVVGYAVIMTKIADLLSQESEKW